ncbi:MAG: peptide deformylase, partial [Alphaproteobacteria bacterium]
MAILKIARMGNPILKRKAEPVADPAAPEIQRLVADMKDTLEDIGGAGLAAPQVYVAKRVVVYRIPAERIPPGSEQTPVGWTTLINPMVEPLSDEMKMNWERCLSVPGLHGKVARHTKIRCTYITLANRPVE